MQKHQSHGGASYTNLSNQASTAYPDGQYQYNNQQMNTNSGQNSQYDMAMKHQMSGGHDSFDEKFRMFQDPQ